MGGRLSWGAGLLLVRPAYVVVELLVAAATTGRYSLRDDTVSDLGAARCSPVSCSPWHDLMNGTFVVVGLLLALGAVALAPQLGRAVTALLVVAGLSTVATGLAPVDGDGTLHALAASPLFVCQPLALLLLGGRLRRPHPRVAGALLLTGSTSAAAAVGFLLVGDGVGAGLLERLALWPVLVALAAAAAVLVPDRSDPSSGGGQRAA